MIQVAAAEQDKNAGKRISILNSLSGIFSNEIVRICLHGKELYDRLDSFTY